MEDSPLRERRPRSAQETETDDSSSHTSEQLRRSHSSQRSSSRDASPLRTTQFHCTTAPRQPAPFTRSFTLNADETSPQVRALSACVGLGRLACRWALGHGVGRSVPSHACANRGLAAPGEADVPEHDGASEQRQLPGGGQSGVLEPPTPCLLTLISRQDLDTLDQSQSPPTPNPHSDIQPFGCDRPMEGVGCARLNTNRSLAVYSKPRPRSGLTDSVGSIQLQLTVGWGKSTTLHKMAAPCGPCGITRECGVCVHELTHGHAFRAA